MSTAEAASRNTLTASQIPIFLAKMKQLHPQHYAMVLLGERRKG
jgi:hypothetical protein